MIFKNFADQSGSDSILLDQDWTRTKKFHSPLISDMFIISSFVINWQFKRIDHEGSHKPVSVLPPSRVFVHIIATS